MIPSARLRRSLRLQLGAQDAGDGGGGCSVPARGEPGSENSGVLGLLRLGQRQQVRLIAEFPAQERLALTPGFEPLSHRVEQAGLVR